MSELTDQIIRASLHRFLGRLARDPEVRFFENGNSVCNARLLVNKPGAKKDDGQQPDGFKLEIWGERAQAFADAAKQGDMVDVTGRIKSETWADRNTGEQRTGLVIVVEVFSIRPRQAAAPAAAPAPASNQPTWNAAPTPAAVPF